MLLEFAFARAHSYLMIFMFFEIILGVYCLSVSIAF